MRERSLFNAFLPRSASAFVFVFAMACYGLALTGLFAGIVAMAHFPPRRPSFWESHGDPTAHIIEALVFAPLIESCFLVAVIELLTFFKAPVVVGVLLTAIVLALPHSFTWRWEPYAFVVLPSFAIQAASYAYWRAVSRMRGFVVAASIHALHNLVPAMFIIAGLTRKT